MSPRKRIALKCIADLADKTLKNIFKEEHSLNVSVLPNDLCEVGARALPGEWTLHTLRHRFATAAYSAERDLLAVQRLLGHASVATTQRYAEPPRDALRKAVEAADIYEHLQ